MKCFQKIKPRKKRRQESDPYIERARGKMLQPNSQVLLHSHVSFVKGYCIFFDTGNDCRNIIFKKPIIGKALKDHVIKRVEVANARSCRVICYMEPSCVSINVGPLEGGKNRCELNSATVENQFTFCLENRSAYTLYAIEVKFYKHCCLYTNFL